jgi:peptide/nickel transport system ATP-binding protein
VLYRGRVVERGPADDVILDPRHPYTRLLAEASPDPRRPRKAPDPGLEAAVAAGAGRTYDHYRGCWAERP